MNQANFKLIFSNVQSYHITSIESIKWEKSSFLFEIGQNISSWCKFSRFMFLMFPAGKIDFTFGFILNYHRKYYSQHFRFHGVSIWIRLIKYGHNQYYPWIVSFYLLCSTTPVIFEFPKLSNNGIDGQGI